jgi:hypothetical protein
MPDNDGMSYPAEDQLKEELAPRMEEKKVSQFEQSLMRQGFASSSREAQIVILILFALTLMGSAYFYYTSREETTIIPRDPYVRPLPRY